MLFEDAFLWNFQKPLVTRSVIRRNEYNGNFIFSISPPLTRKHQAQVKLLRHGLILRFKPQFKPLLLKCFVKYIPTLSVCMT